jgi:hypothetical protein
MYSNNVKLKKKNKTKNQLYLNKGANSLQSNKHLLDSINYQSGNLLD